MKKLIIVAILAIGLTGFAQEGKKGRRPAEETIEMKVKKLTEELTLNADQQNKITSIIQEHVAKRKDNKENSENKEANKGEMKVFTDKIKAVLTPEQFKKWKALKKEHREKKEDKKQE